MRSPSGSPMVYEELSSPDPLASSPASTTNTSTKIKHTTVSSTLRERKAIRKSIENISILPPSSPSKTVTEQTLSPWKIRVTVEAEPEDGAEASVQGFTRTTIVPLKGGESPPQPKSCAGRRSPGRHRAGSGASNRRRSATPTTERRRRQSVTDLDIIVLGDDEDEEEWGRRQRKRSPKKNGSKKKTIGRSLAQVEQSGTPDFEVRQDADIEEILDTTDREESPELRQIDLNRVSVRTRSNSTKANAKLPAEENNTQVSIRQLKPLPEMATFGRRTVSANSAMTYPTPSPTASERGRSVEVEDRAEEPQTHLDGFDTIMESEGFTMIDLDSIPSVKRMLSSPLEGRTAADPSPQNSETNSETSVRKFPASATTTNSDATIRTIRAIPPYIVLPEDESEISSTLPSSPPSLVSLPQTTQANVPLSYLQVPVQPRNRQVTPQPYSSPKLPSPPRQSASKDRSTPDSAKAMRAALALQGAVQPVVKAVVSGPSQRPDLLMSGAIQNSSSSSSSNELFEGFDSGMQRELRAGLRFGEELAKRQQPQSIAKTYPPVLGKESQAPVTTAVELEVDNVDNDNDDGDIWLEEAKDSSSSPRQDIEYQIPFSQRSNQHNENNSTIITNGDDMSGMLWRQQEQEDIRFGAAAIENVKKSLKLDDGHRPRRTSGAFDIEKMLGTPKRIRESLAKEQEQRLSFGSTAPIGASKSQNERDQIEIEDDEYEEETSGESMYSDESHTTTQQPVQTIPVNFNDSTLSHLQNTPPQSSRARESTSPSVARPPTPRSAMKGSRRSFGAALEGQVQAERRVIFAERSRTVNVDWEESSSSLQASDENAIDSPTVAHQKHHEQRHLVAVSLPDNEIVRRAEVEQTSHDHDYGSTQFETQPQSQSQPQGQKGWLGWIWSSKAVPSPTNSTNTVQVDGTSEGMGSRLQPVVESGNASNTQQQAPEQTSERQTERSYSTVQHKAQLPSYLLPPSYPSDPKCLPNAVLPTSSLFTNTHFRILHILYRKSQRSRFHAPEFVACRPEIRSLVNERWKLEVDESSAGLGAFEWTVGETEARVLERFCREIEFGHLRKGARDAELDVLSGEWCGVGGIWGGNVAHGSADVRWEWSVTQLATWLGRIVVGEVVRSETS